MRIIIHLLLIVLLMSACSDQVVFEHDHPQDRANPDFVVTDPTSVVIVNVPVGVGFRIRSRVANMDSIVVDKALEGQEFARYAALPFSTNAVFVDTGRIAVRAKYRFRNMIQLASGPTYSESVDINLPESFLNLTFISLNIENWVAHMAVYGNAASIANVRAYIIQDDEHIVNLQSSDGDMNHGEFGNFGFSVHVSNLAPSPKFFIRTVAESYIRLPGRDSVLTRYQTQPVLLPFVSGAKYGPTLNFDQYEIRWNSFLPAARQDLSFRMEVRNNQGLWNTSYVLDRNATSFSLSNHDPSLWYRLQLVMGDSLYPNPYYFQ